MGAHHGALGDLLFLHIVEELGGVVVGPVVDALVGIRPLDGLGLHCSIVPETGHPTRPKMCNSGGMKHGPELSFDDEGRPVLITRAALPQDEQHRERVRKYLKIMAFRIPALILAAGAYGIWHNGLISLAILLV